ncbi:MAG: single-stranded-DNA-specific exonuclease RecJ [Candidatus Falkowbacteria bacterium]|nr:single-stranded-DNA-specific exonuclease RecJ [Candidatus Falkowbacteria bacterium]
MQKSWHLLPKIEDSLRPNYAGFPPVIAQLLFNRGLKAKKEIEDFFSSSEEAKLFDPFLFTDMEQASAMIIKHIQAQDKIMVYGDYDADGVTASALLWETLNTLKAQVDVYLPDRVTEGYGLNRKAIDFCQTQGVKLIITVDCGIRDKDNVAYAASQGIEVIITDHHLPPEDESNYPDCLIINPQTKNNTYPDKNLAGVGVAFKLAEALVKKSKLSNDKKEKIISHALDLVAIGTIADIVSLLGENRNLVKKGLAALNKTKRIGLIELIKTARLEENKNLDAGNIGYQIAPRINAAGRMEHANSAFKLLVAKDQTEAQALAQGLNEQNTERQRLTDEIFIEVDRQAAKQAEEKIIIGLCQLDDEEISEIWNEGLIGLVAGKICEKYYCPTFVITAAADGYKGSGRSIPELNIIKVIEKTAQFLERYGGHPGACGFNLKKENLNKFLAAVRQEVAVELGEARLQPQLSIESELGLEEVNLELAEKIETFAPFGRDNERPRFISRNVRVIDITNLGQNSQHLKLRLQSQQSGFINALGFGQTEKWNHLRTNDLIDIVYYIDINNFNNRQEVQLKIIDIKKVK